MVKRLFDIVLSFVGLLLMGGLLLLLWLAITVFSRSNGIFIQDRIGRFGQVFRIYKLKTLYPGFGPETFISRFGQFLRKSKLDEFPQLWNVLIGDMSIVGPRPDIPGYYDKLTGADREILKLRPGVTGPASLKYADEETLLKTKENPLQYNDQVIFPDKIRINRVYQEKQSLWLDLKIIFYTIFGRTTGSDDMG